MIETPLKAQADVEAIPATSLSHLTKVMEPVKLWKTIRLPRRCTRTATPTEIMSGVEKTRQMYRCSLLHEETCSRIFNLLERIVAMLRKICTESQETGIRYDLNRMRDALHELISALQRRKTSIAEDVESCLADLEEALRSIPHIKETTFQLDPALSPGLLLYSVGHRIQRQ